MEDEIVNIRTAITNLETDIYTYNALIDYIPTTLTTIADAQNAYIDVENAVYDIEIVISDSVIDIFDSQSNMNDIKTNIDAECATLTPDLDSEQNEFDTSVDEVLDIDIKHY
ncbi:hypothetical protein ALNOE001_07780 [Candidatus Methanobinarius endosymbioticus]|uniref:Uncharacterized protein n=1 Tax=Candidatus Methanobinarius endosymbioticus TaxID=2006182 RepID=A0A366ME19_9EURY|nr:hypothetical protein ALNOE001_07780 [Candidatus Methanobinarius endosymbioticus]